MAARPVNDIPKKCGRATVIPVWPPLTSLRLKTTSSITNAKASVARARYRPDSRSDTRPTMIPSGAANSMPITTAKRKCCPCAPARCPAVKAPTPTNENCAREICPAHPVSTTSVSAITA